MPRGAEIDTFVIARFDWSVDWERRAVEAATAALANSELEQIEAIRWRGERGVAGPRYVLRTEATGEEARTALLAAIAGDDGPSDDPSRSRDAWQGMYFRWSSAEAATRALAFRAGELLDDVGTRWPPGSGLDNDWGNHRGVFLQTIGIYVWGGERGPVLDALGNSLRQAEAQERKMETVDGE